MDSQFFIFVIAYLGVFLADIVKSQQNLNPPPLGISQLPPQAPVSPPQAPVSPPPPPRKFLHSPTLKNITLEHSKSKNHKKLHRYSIKTPQKKIKLNSGKKIGLIFVGVAGILQVCVAAFLFIRRRQIMKAEKGY